MQNRVTKIALLAFEFLLAVPCFAFLVWVERQGTLPWLTNRMGWPAIYLDSNLDTQVALNLVLLTALAGWIIGCVRLKANRITFGLGISIFGIVIFSLWQPSGVILWSWINHAIFAQITSFLAFWGFAFAGYTISREPQSKAYRRNQDLVLYALALVVTPWLSLDRLLMISVFVTAAAVEIKRRKKMVTR